MLSPPRGSCRFLTIPAAGLEHQLPLLRDALAWFECQVVSEHPAGDHLLVLGKVIDGKLLDAEAEPMCYRETGAMDGASTLYPEVLGES
jgi:flavin reductase (DIM6/NTAB) family NADH-FMN oxidoreductase RutF